MKNIVTVFMVNLIIVSMFTLAFNVWPVNASGTIYIRADGSIDPPTANITSIDNATYIFTGNNYDEIVVERNNIVVDGAGYTLQGTGSGYGITLSGRNNVTLRNIEIYAFYRGVSLDSSSNNTVSGNTITNNSEYGVCLYPSSSNNTVSGNTITSNNVRGVYLSETSYNTISGNGFVDDGLYVLGSFGNVVVDNLVNGKPLVYLEDVSDLVVEDAGQVILVNCNNIRLEHLNLSNTTVGAQLWNTNSTTITGNTITNNRDGVHLSHSSNNTVSGNIISSNYIDGVKLRMSFNNTVSGNIIANNVMGVFLYSSVNNAVSGNTITNNGYGVLLWYSYFNTVLGNTITSNYDGIYLNQVSNNTIYHNNIVNNTRQTYNVDSINIWDNGCEGNYWSNYNGTDLDADGVGETNLPWEGVDNYPLMNPYWSPGDIDHDLDVDIYDIVKAAGIYGSTPLDPKWNPHCDIAEPFGVIDIFDLVMIAGSYGKEYVP